MKLLLNVCFVDFFVVFAAPSLSVSGVVL